MFKMILRDLTVSIFYEAKIAINISNNKEKYFHYDPILQTFRIQGKIFGNILTNNNQRNIWNTKAKPIPQVV